MEHLTGQIAFDPETEEWYQIMDSTGLGRGVKMNMLYKVIKVIEG